MVGLPFDLASPVRSQNWRQNWGQRPCGAPPCTDPGGLLISKIGADGEIRTPGQRFTKPLLYH